MNELLERKISCPYCGEFIWILVESVDDDQEYVEDCQVCCQPIIITIHIMGNGDVSVMGRAENE